MYIFASNRASADKQEIPQGCSFTSGLLIWGHRTNIAVKISVDSCAVTKPTEKQNSMVICPKLGLELWYSRQFCF